MLIALAFAHFSSELLWKEQMIIPVKKTLKNAGHIDAQLIDFSWICPQKIQRNRLFLLIVSRRSFPPRNFPWNRPIFPRILTFFLRKSSKIGRLFLEFAPENPAKFCFFSAKSQKPSSIYFIAGKCPSWAPFWIFWLHTCVNRHQMWDPSFLSCCSYPSCSDNE